MVEEQIMKVGAYVIGSELVQGKRRDQHREHCIDALGRRRLGLSWCEVVGDSPEVLTRMLRQSMETEDVVFSFGGLGSTPRDHTRACAARAAGVKLVRNEAAAKAIESQFGKDAYPDRIRMADLPQGCSIIPNPVNRCPGFSLGDHHFLPAFPDMAWPMMEWVLDKRYSPESLRGKAVEYLIHTHDTRENDLLDLMEALVDRFPEVHLSSMPQFGDQGTEVQFGVRGSEREVRSGMQWLTGELNARGYRWEAMREN